MAITVPDNFSYGGKKPNFDRDQFETLEAMTSYPKDFLDEGHISYCVETKKVYIWNGLAWEVLTSTEIVPITYSELKNLRDNSQLVAGTTYRLTDYEFTTVQENTKSAGHGFDIILQALSSSELSEQGFALPREGDSHFNGNSLSSWQIWYTLENDSSRYRWADEKNGKGVIYRMIDEYQNDCPYDFKNCLFLIGNMWLYTFALIDNQNIYDLSTYRNSALNNTIAVCFESKTFNTSRQELSYNVLQSYLSDSRKIVKDNIIELNCTKNIITDSSNIQLIQQSYGNKIGSSDFVTLILGNNNTIRYCDNINFGFGCSGNKLNDVNQVTFKDYCDNNTIYGGLVILDEGNYLYTGNISFGSYCSGNIINKGSSSITLGNKCSNNRFGEKCIGNSLKDESSENGFDNGCAYNSLGIQCVFNRFGQYCKNNTIGSYCTNVIFKDNVTDRVINKNKKLITYDAEYYDDESGKLVPVKHPNLSTQTSILPYKFAGEYVYEQIWYVRGKDIVGDTAEVVSNTISENVLLLESVVTEITSSGSKITNRCETYAEGTKIYTKGLSKDKHYWVRVVWTTNPIELKDKYDYGYEY